MNSEAMRINGVAVAPDGFAAERVMRLPSGASAEVRRGYGRDLMHAQRAANSAEPCAIIYALIAELARIDGRPIVYEDVLGMEIADVLMLQDEVAGTNFRTAASPPPPQSPASSSLDLDSRSWAP
ncbi:MAG: hypothetical protein ACREP6_00100 [Candidatus Binataceae bacterium]